MNILISRNNEQFGPYSVDEIEQHLQSGAIANDELAWREGLAEWMPLHTVLPPKVETPQAPVPKPQTPIATESGVAAATAFQHNPYSPPQSVTGQNVADEYETFEFAGKGQRLLNYFIDYLAVIGCGFLLGIFIAIAFGDEAFAVMESIPEFVLGFIIFSIYYIVTEGIWNRSLGKLITGTKVVQEDGGRPTFAQIIGRTLCRFIPFEALSFLGEEGSGWHDSMSSTRVIKTR
tara:strand:+ start:15759 stop:16457 length:699 start_codon:yes stop_codon:yes gene_type:complete